MTTPSDLHWLPPLPDADMALRALGRIVEPQERVRAITCAALHRLDFLQTAKLDRLLAKTLAEMPEGAPLPGLAPIKLAWLASSTVDHLVPATRIAGLRRGLLVESHVAPFNQYRQELLDPGSALARFSPHAVLWSLDPGAALPVLPRSATAAEAADAVGARIRDIRQLWAQAKGRFRCIVVHETVADTSASLFGSLDRKVPASAASLTAALDEALAEAAAEDGVLLLDLAALASRLGSDALFDPVRWHHGKQLVAPTAAPLYGDHVARVLAAARGLSRKCLVVDLDNTLWGGVVGDDGIEHLVLGQGSAAGEAFVAFQRFVKELGQRGIVLAVCSKNDQATAESVFDRHPEMVLRRADIAVFVASWDDKATNLRSIAATLNLGLDSLVFFDDNPAERAVVRLHLPAVAVPEAPEEPALYARCLADAGYFEAAAFTADDTARARHYHDNAQREELRRASPGDLDGFLRSLAMTMHVGAVGDADIGRVTQLINKTNQWNLTTRRYTEAEVRVVRATPLAMCLHFRLEDTFGDNGIISVLFAKPKAVGEATLAIDTWLMSCRVLGRGVESAVLNALAAAAIREGFAALEGDYLPTPKNALVRDQYDKLGFRPIAEGHAGEGSRRYRLDLRSFTPHPVHIVTRFEPA